MLIPAMLTRVIPPFTHKNKISFYYDGFFLSIYTIIFYPIIINTMYHFPREK